VHHSDRGSQYTSLAFGKTLRESGLVASMGSRGDAYDNAACESCISTLKREWIKRHRYTSRDHARLSIFQYIETFYNPRRRHSALGGISPDEYERRCLNRQEEEERIDTIEATRAA
jgi:putative transposase